MQVKWKMQKVPESVKHVKELFPAPRVYDFLRREPSTDDREWLSKELSCHGRFTGIAWILSPEPPGKTQLPLPTVEEIILSPDWTTNRSLPYIAWKLAYNIRRLWNDWQWGRELTQLGKI